jgi:uncharacterized protein YkwD/uncharacterized membrane protein required for colicin V production
VNRIDAVLLVILAIYAFLGYRRGLLAVALDWLGLALALALALWLSPGIGAWAAARYGVVAIAARVLAFVGVLIGARLLWSIVEALLWRRIPRALRQSSANRVAGIAPGLLQGGLIAALALLTLAALPLPIVPRAEIAASPIGSALLRWGAAVQSTAQRWMGGTVRDLIGFRPAPLKEGEKVDLPFRTTHAAIDPEAEAAMLRLVNAERRKQGLAPLRMDEKLRQVARAHARDLLARGYFAHDTPEGRSPFDRLRAAGIDFTAAGENIAFAPDVQTAHAGLMSSPGHRANIQRPAFRHVGIGALRAPPFGVMFSQEFRD